MRKRTTGARGTGARRSRRLPIALIAVLSVALLSFPPVPSASAAELTLAWDTNGESDIAGYRLHYGYASRDYPFTVDAGSATAFTINDLENGRVYFIAATAYDAYGNESPYSDEVIANTAAAADADGDGIPDETEQASCTDYLDADSDDDGIRDGIEDADLDGIRDAGETDPCEVDTDGDGIQDGTELGYTLADVSGDTDLLVFQPDLDPSSTTDPLETDSDGDGFSDGYEDANANGMVDTGEMNPASPAPEPLFADDFFDGDSSGDPDWEESSGNWSVSDRKRFVSSARRRDLAQPLAVGAFSGGIIRANVRLTDRAARKPNAAVIFALDGDGGRRYVRMSPRRMVIGQSVATAAEDAGVKAVLKKRFGTNRWHELIINVHPDGLVEVFLDGESTASLSYAFADPLWGGIGLGAARARSLFDDFAVWPEEVLTGAP